MARTRVSGLLCTHERRSPTASRGMRGKKKRRGDAQRPGGNQRPFITALYARGEVLTM